MEGDRNVLCVVEAVGRVNWLRVSNDSDERYVDDGSIVALVRLCGEHRMRHYVTPGMCYRNGTTITQDIVGCEGTLYMIGASPIGFSCPTMFGNKPKRVSESQPWWGA